MPLVSNFSLFFSIPRAVAGPDEESRMENEELLPLKRELAERAGAKTLDSYGYYL